MATTTDRGRQWTQADIPDQFGRTAVVTGASSGLGLDTARILASRGAGVVLACRDAAKARDALAGAAAASKQADAAAGRPAREEAVFSVALDLADLGSVRAAADEILKRCPRIDLLINNAGVMDTPYGTTRDGFELQLGTNHLGHHALTGLLLDRMLESPGSRVVTVSSLNHRQGVIDFDDLGFEHGYRPGAAYCRSKLANLMFTYELQRRLEAAGAQTAALAAHPGLSKTELFRNLGPVLSVVQRLAISVMGQSSEMGSLPTLRAAADPAARGGEYYGPGGRSEAHGYPKKVESTPRSHDAEAQQRLWSESERMTGVSYSV
ncbi:MAG TPA: oxidoreductase [Actinocrinis sp.]|jgi:NAD(P)-dependent dehydrogenase (short-subunit alcohol dehydrogenase family)